MKKYALGNISINENMGLPEKQMQPLKCFYADKQV